MPKNKLTAARELIAHITQRNVVRALKVLDYQGSKMSRNFFLVFIARY